jgi:hypothetical protein
LGRRSRMITQDYEPDQLTFACDRRQERLRRKQDLGDVCFLDGWSLSGKQEAKDLQYTVP